MASIQNKKFCFHRCFCPQKYSQKMEIPISYMGHVHRDSLRKTLRKKVLLRNSAMKIWTVGITQTEDRVFFHNGWETFVKEHCLKSGYHLVFEFDGHSVFDFLLFDNESNVKIAVLKKLEKIDIKKEYHTEETYTNGNDVAGDGANDGADDEAGDGVDDDADDDNDYSGGSDGGDEGDEEEEEQVPHSKRRRQKRDVGVEERISHKEIKDVPDHYGIDIFKSGRFTQPINPYFVAGIRSKRRNDLYIPRDVIKDIVLPPTIILRDPIGREWKMKTKVWADGRTWMSGGWMNLCRRNLVEKNARLICEFLPREEGKDDVVLQVTAIVREGDF